MIKTKPVWYEKTRSFVKKWTNYWQESGNKKKKDGKKEKRVREFYNGEA